MPDLLISGKIRWPRILVSGNTDEDVGQLEGGAGVHLLSRIEVFQQVAIIIVRTLFRRD